MIEYLKTKNSLQRQFPENLSIYQPNVQKDMGIITNLSKVKEYSFHSFVLVGFKEGDLSIRGSISTRAAPVTIERTYFIQYRYTEYRYIKLK